MLLRGQSNAVLIDYFGAIWQAQTEAERLLGFDGVNDKINVISSYGQDTANTMNSGTAFLKDWLSPHNGDWQQGWDIGNLEQGLLAAINAQPADVKADPTGVVWLHNEYDSAQQGLTAAEWESAVRLDAAHVRAAFGQDAATVPYLFVNAIPYSNARNESNQAIKQGMEDLARDPSFHATIAAQANDLDMNLGGNYGDAHMGAQDAATLAHRIAVSFAQTFAAYAKPGSPVANAGGQIDDLGPQVVKADPVAGHPDQLQLTVTYDAASHLSPLDAVAASGTGWSVHTAGGEAQGTAAQILDGNHLLVTFDHAVSAGDTLFYGYGYGRISGPDGTGAGHAVYDDQGMPVWTAPEGVAVGGPAVQPELVPTASVPLTAPALAPAAAADALATAPLAADAAEVAAPAPAASAPAVPVAVDLSAPVDWNTLAAQVTANFEATGHWFL